MLRDIPLRGLIALGILFCGLIPLFLVSLVGFNAARTELKAQAFRQLQSVRDIKITVLRKFYFERRADIRVFAANPYIGQAYAALSSSTGPDARAAYDPYLKALLREYEYDDLMLLRPDDGSVVYTQRLAGHAGAREGADTLPPGLAAVWQEARAGRAGLSDVRLEAEPDGTPAQYLAAPIAAGGRVVGIIAVRLAPDAVDSIVRERSGLGATGITYISGPDGELKAPLRPRPARPESGKRVLAVQAPVGVEGLDWILHAEVDEGEVEGQIARALNRRLMVLIGGSTLLLAALAFLIARGLGRAVRRVIDELHRLVRDVLAGRLRSRARPELMAADFRPVLAEINVLIEAFEKQIEASRRLEVHLRDAQRLEVIGSLAGGIAHDFNNLLAHMRALTHILSEEARADGRDQAHLDDLTLALHRGADLVRQILTFSRPGQDRRGSLDLREAAAETLRLIKAALPAGIRLEFEPGSEPLPIVGGPSQVQQVVMNLCLNAVQAHAGGRRPAARDPGPRRDGRRARRRRGGGRLCPVDRGG